MKLIVKNNKFNEDDVFGSISTIMTRNPLATIASINRNDMKPWVATVFYTFDLAEMKIFFLSNDKTKHGRNFKKNENIALNIFNSKQEWTDEKKGIQVSAVIKKLRKDQNLKGVLSQYLKKYKGLKRWITDITNIDDFEPDFYEVDIETLKVLDEEKFGSSSWVEIFVER